MRIDTKVTTPITSNEARKAAPRETQAPATTGTKASVVQLSSAATAAARPAAHGITARLEKIKALVDAGQYPVDLDKLAERIVDDDLLRAPGKDEP